MRPASYVLCIQCNADLTKEGTKRSRCAGCHSVFYDDVTCQKKDWPIHKTECKERQRRFIAAVRFHFPEVDTMAKLLANAEACGIISLHYTNGTGGFPHNQGLGTFWSMQWMKGGDVNAILLTGMAHCAGAVPHKHKEGVMLLKRACLMLKADGSLDPLRLHRAQCEIGESYMYGRGVDADMKESMKWIRLAAEGGLDRAQYALGCIYGGSVEGEQDPEESAIWYRKAAEQGHAAAQYRLGLALWALVHNPKVIKSGEFVEITEALEWIRKSAEQGNADAEFTQGTCFMDGCGVMPDPTKAVVWFRKSADQGNAQAQYQLGSCYFRGHGVAVNRGEAIRLYRLSAAQGNDDAKAALRNLGAE